MSPIYFQCWLFIFFFILDTPRVVVALSSVPLSVVTPKEAGYVHVTRSIAVTPASSLLCGGGAIRPLQTNSWWVPAITPVATEHNPSRRITPIPYVYSMREEFFRVSYPYMLATEDVINTIIDPPDNDWVIGAATTELDGYCLQKGSKLTADFMYRASGVDVMEVIIVRGDPFVTMRYISAAFDLQTNQNVKQFTLDGKVAECDEGTALTGHKLVLQLADTDSEWTIWLPPGTSVRCRASPARIYGAEETFSGIVRLAITKNCTTGLPSPRTGAVAPQCIAAGTPNDKVEPYMEALDASSNAMITSAEISFFPRDRSTLIYSIDWHSKPCWEKVTKISIPIVLALPHHMSQFRATNTSGITVIAAGGHRSITGYATPVIGNRWELYLVRQPIPWLGNPDSDKVSVLQQTLRSKKDAGFDVPYECSHGIMDTYNAGKLMARLAQLILMSDQLGMKDLVMKHLRKLKSYLNVWLDHLSEDRLFYDDTWGGIISCGCQYSTEPLPPHCKNNAEANPPDCPAFSDVGADFGLSFYNDHHFHFGYIIYAAAVMAKFDRAWGQAYQDKVLMLVRDIANPSESDPYFPQFRHFDWYVGHSWAQGIVSNPNGLNQESGSEALNAHYAVYLYGSIIESPQLTTVAESMLLVEATSIQYYWQLHKERTTYPSQYKHDMVGIVWDRLLEYQTFFGKQPFFVYGIQLIPITHIIHIYMKQGPWLKEALQAFKHSCLSENPVLCKDSGFISFLYASLALLDKESAWRKARALPDSVFDPGCAGCSGNSRSNLLHFIASVGNPVSGADVQSTRMLVYLILSVVLLLAAIASVVAFVVYRHSKKRSEGYTNIA